MKRLLLDQGLPRSTAALLTQAGWDVVHASEIVMSRAEDVDIVQRARAEVRVCVTLDADCHSLLATSGERGPSVIGIRKKALTGPRSRPCCKVSGPELRARSRLARW